MVTINTNIQAVVKELQAKLLNIVDKDKVIRAVAATMAPEVRRRIHVNGKAADNSNIGTYSEKYHKYTRKKYNRTEPKSKVVISLTRTMENSFTSGANNPEPTKTRLGYGLGFLGAEQVRIAGYMEELYGKKIWALTSRERNIAMQTARFEVRKILNAKARR